MQVFETADTDADTDMKVFETADTDADTDMNFSKNRGHGHGADKPRTRVSADLCHQRSILRPVPPADTRFWTSYLLTDKK